MNHSPVALEFLNAIATKFNLTDKTTCINVALATMVKSGIPLNAAFDVLFGEGSYKAFAGKIYDALRSQAVG